jgi:endonuclease YncB( thermonuclease family)
MICATLLAVDGDTVKCDGQNLRPMGNGAPYVSGFDAPELGQYADCPAEARRGFHAAARMADLLLTPGLVVLDSGQVDRYRRPLVVLQLPDGKTIGQVLIDEGHAVAWEPGYKSAWCE